MPNIRGPELLILVLIIVLLFGAKRLPDAARGIGRSLRIFKAETKGLVESDDDEQPADQPRGSGTSSASDTSRPAALPQSPAGESNQPSGLPNDTRDEPDSTQSNAPPAPPAPPSRA